MMAKNRNNDKKRKREPLFSLEAETKKAIVGTLFAAAGLILVLAIFNLAGPAGQIVSRGFSWLLGWGYFLLPLAFWVLAIVFFVSERQNFYFSAIFGVFLILASLLGVTNELGKSSGVLGVLAGSISYLFGFWATLVILLALGVIGFLLTFNVSFKKKPKDLMSSAPLPKEIVSAPPFPASPPVLTRVWPESKKESEIEIASSDKAVTATWQFPPLKLLEREDGRPSAGDIKTSAKIIQRTLENFAISVEMSEVHVGPTVTQYTLKPAQGVKLSKIVSLQNDLSLALAAHPLRIEAPIPGKALVGIEVPNRLVARVRLGSLLDLPAFKEARSALTFPLGRDVMGEAVFTDLSRMPHLLVAGATGSGKSIFIHSLILTMFFKNAPSSIRLILIDPKRVELSQYNNIPYLLTPVITDGKRAIQALRWAIAEMERRYDLLLEAGARDVFSYNEKVSNGSIPFILIVIDELADLMAAYGREIEGSVVRLAQMARATGIHLVVSTQRPSVEVITGLIKANITSRVAFQVASQVDSRTILDMAGAEKLLGSGDMLYLAADAPKPRRIQAPLVSESEVARVCNFTRKVGESLEGATDFESVEDLDEMLAKPESDLAGSPEAESYYDEFYPEAYRVVIAAKKASASLLQRRLKIGYARAARLLDILEAKGIIGPGEGAKPRKIYIDDNRD